MDALDMGLLRGEPSLSFWRASRLLLLADFLRFFLPLCREVGGQQHLESLGEVFHEMPFVGDLDGLRRSFERSCRIFGRPVSADQLDAWMRCEPGGNGFYRPIGHYEGLLEVLSTLKRLFRAWSSARSFRSACREALL